MIVFATPRNQLKAGLALLLAAAVGGCALSPFDEDSTFRRTTTQVGVTSQLAEPADFVKNSRTGSEEYPPVGITPAPPKIPARQGGGIAEFEQQLTALRQRNEQIAAQPRPSSPYDGKIEPGYKAPPPPPLPAYTGPRVDVPEAKAADATAAADKKSTDRKPKDKKAKANSSTPGT